VNQPVIFLALQAASGRRRAVIPGHFPVALLDTRTLVSQSWFTTPLHIAVLRARRVDVTVRLGLFPLPFTEVSTARALAVAENHGPDRKLSPISA